MSSPAKARSRTVTKKKSTKMPSSTNIAKASAVVVRVIRIVKK